MNGAAKQRFYCENTLVCCDDTQPTTRAGDEAVTQPIRHLSGWQLLNGLGSGSGSATSFGPVETLCTRAR